MKTKVKDRNILFIVFTVVLGAVIWYFVKQAKAYREASKDEFISEDGKDILANETKRAKLNEAIDEYREKGSWEKLKEIQS